MNSLNRNLLTRAIQAEKTLQENLYLKHEFSAWLEQNNKKSRIIQQLIKENSELKHSKDERDKLISKIQEISKQFDLLQAQITDGQIITTLHICELCKHIIYDYKDIVRISNEKYCHSQCRLKQITSNADDTITIIIVTENDFKQKINQRGIVNYTSNTIITKCIDNVTINDVKLLISSKLYPIQNQQPLFEMIPNNSDGIYTISEKPCPDDYILRKQNKNTYIFWLCDDLHPLFYDIIFIKTFNAFHGITSYVKKIAPNMKIETLKSYLPLFYSWLGQPVKIFNENDLTRPIDVNNTFEEAGIKHGSILVVTQDIPHIEEKIQHFYKNTVINSSNTFGFRISKKSKRTFYMYEHWWTVSCIFKENGKLGIYLKYRDDEDMEIKVTFTVLAKGFRIDKTFKYTYNTTKNDWGYHDFLGNFNYTYSADDKLMLLIKLETLSA